jgi:hypothetical protein
METPKVHPEQLYMKTTKKLMPGQPGTKKLFEQYGSDLVCVRYRYDSEQRLKFKTIELIVEKGPWRGCSQDISAERIVHLRIEYGEVELGRQVKAAGGKWNGKKRVWELPYKDALVLGLTGRILQDTALTWLKGSVLAPVVSVTRPHTIDPTHGLAIGCLLAFQVLHSTPLATDFPNRLASDNKSFQYWKQTRGRPQPQHGQ